MIGKLATALARPRRYYDAPAAVRLGAWGLCAVLAIIFVVAATRSETGARRLGLRTDPPQTTGARPTASDLVGRTASSERESRMLAQEIRALADDRERLMFRVAALERALAAVETTGATGPTREAANAKPVQSSATRPPYPPIDLPVTPTATASANAAGAPEASAPTQTTGEPRPSAARPGAELSPNAPAEPRGAPPGGSSGTSRPGLTKLAAAEVAVTAQPTQAPAIAVATVSPTTGDARVEPRSDSKLTASEAAPPPASAASAGPTGPAAGAPERRQIPQEKLPDRAPLAALEAPDKAGHPAAPAATSLAKFPSASEPSAPAARGKPAAESVAIKTVFGIDLGSGGSPAGLREAWAAVKKQQGTLVAGLRPVMSVRDNGSTLELRLIAGPIPNAAQAARICAAMASAGRACAPAIFDGQKLGP